MFANKRDKMTGKWGFESSRREENYSNPNVGRSEEGYRQLAKSGWLVREVDLDDGRVDLFAKSCGKVGTALEKISAEAFGYELGFYDGNGQLYPGISLEGEGTSMRFVARGVATEMAEMLKLMMTDLGRPIDPSQA